ncbi:MAG: DoxX family protein [Egibacteraceae bacterium]
MSILRRAARVMMSSIFISGGLDALLDPGSKVPVARDVATKVASPFPWLADQSAETLVNAGVQVGAGALLVLGRCPRLSAMALASSLVPTTAAGHRFWEKHDEAERRQQQIHFLKNVSILGGLLIAILDTQGQPGLAWRTRHAADRPKSDLLSAQ